jgi:RNA polymerase sigma factor (sigma-70 family)
MVKSNGGVYHLHDWLKLVGPLMVKGAETYKELEHLSEEDLVELFQRGECPFTVVLERVNPLLLSRCNSWTPPRVDKEDLYQEFLIKTHHCCQRWRRDKQVKFTTYLHNGLDNKIKQLVREVNAKKRLSEQDAVSYEELLEESSDFIPSPPHKFEDIVELKIMIENLELEPNERTCVNMVFEGLLKTDIADKLNLSKARIYQILKSLRPKFKFLREQVD